MAAVFPEYLKKFEEIPRITYNLLDDNFIVDVKVDFNNRELFYFIDSIIHFEILHDFILSKGVSYEKILKPHLESRLIHFSNIKILINEEIMALPSKPLNIEKSFENLVSFKFFCEKFGINYFLAFGTLLGFYRDGDFIKHDCDTDVGILKKDKVSFITALPALIEMGFKVIRFTENLISISRHDEYIDIYIFSLKSYWNKKIWICNGYIYPFLTLTSFSSIEIKGLEFCVPKKTSILLESLYGKSWRIPIENKHAQPEEFIVPTFTEKVIFRIRKIIRF
jgi:hypothetical protein